MTAAERVTELPVVSTVNSPVTCSRCHCRSNRVAFIKKGAVVNVVCEDCLKRPKAR